MTETTFPRDGDLVTVTYDDGKMTRAWHGRLVGYRNVLTTETQSFTGPLYEHYFANTRLTAADLNLSQPEGRDTMRPMAVIRPANDYYALETLDLPVNGPGWTFTLPVHAAADGPGMAIDPAHPGVQILPLTRQGNTFLATRTTAEHQRRYLIDRFAQTDPGRAVVLDQVIDALIASAREEGYGNAVEEMNERMG